MIESLNMPGTVLVVGPGQMGGAFAKAIAAASPATRLTAWSSSEDELLLCTASGLFAQAGSDAKALLAQADFVMLALPIDPLVDFVQRHAADFRPGCVVSDLSSVKCHVINEVRPVLARQGVHFVGSHPMAGSEKTGFVNADPAIYQRAVVFLTPFPTDDPAAIAITRELWRQVGSIPIECDATLHDQTVAGISHLMHLVAYTLIHAGMEQGKRDLARIAAAGSFRDMTRVAGSNPELWSSVCRYNAGPITEAIDHTLAELHLLRDILSSQDWPRLMAYFAEGKALRDDWWNFSSAVKAGDSPHG